MADCGDRPPGACDACLRRSWLLGRLAGHLETVRGRVLELPDATLIEAIGGREADALAAELEQSDPGALLAQASRHGLELTCRHQATYPPRLRELACAPAVLHAAGERGRAAALLDGDVVALVGSRKPSEYGIAQARALGRGLAAAGVAVLSGMALGIDAAAHEGALEVGGPTVALLAAGAERPYPASSSRLYRRILAGGAAVSELPAGTPVRRWMFPARNRLIAAAASMTVVVEAAAGSGALLTAALASALGRPVGAVPGRVGSRQAEGPNGLLAAGALVIRGAQDVLDHLFGAGVRSVAAVQRAPLDPELERLLDAVADGLDTPAALARAGFDPKRGLAALAVLELEGYLRRGAGGRFTLAG